ncbi:hypothetical protein [Ruoffia tabacinasalis]|uniref:DUF4879 domain-containing protein n=1 Tax=Ruoffia tabacinasalis TaxID=87458 RepID=A0ABS0LJ00_9LACT|nr:hypothetical protein [Ruoffia tabacinasalis]MBG9978255.1 hypothetical protein [Ruoffia tabacinasalis]
MKKIIALILLTISLGNVTLSHTEASNFDSSDIENNLSAHTIRKTVTVFVGYGSFPPSYSSTYSYNDGLYKGILHESYSERRYGGGIGDKMYAWYVTYTGYVTSNSGNPISRVIVEE